MAEGTVLEVPALWPLEVANALLVLVRRRLLSDESRRAALGFLQGLRTHVDHEASSLAFSRISELATAYQLSVCDATYLELAGRHQLVLGCHDGPLLKAARRAGVRTWE